MAEKRNMQSFHKIYEKLVCLRNNIIDTYHTINAPYPVYMRVYVSECMRSEKVLFKIAVCVWCTNQYPYHVCFGSPAQCLLAKSCNICNMLPRARKLRSRTFIRNVFLNRSTKKSILVPIGN